MTLTLDDLGHYCNWSGTFKTIYLDTYLVFIGCLGSKGHRLPFSEITMSYHGVALKCVFWSWWWCNMTFLMIIKLMMFLLIMMMMIWLVIQEHWVFKHIVTRSFFSKSAIFRLTLILCNDLDLWWAWLWLQLIEHPQNYISRYLFCVNRLFSFRGI